MKTAVAIALIICGTVIIAIPPASDFFYMLFLTRLMERPGIVSVNLDGKMGDNYRIGCWLVGAVMIGIGVLASLRSAQTSSHDLPLVNTTT